MKEVEYKFANLNSLFRGVKTKNLKYDLLNAKKSARIFEKNLQKSIFSLLEGSNGFHS